MVDPYRPFPYVEWCGRGAAFLSCTAYSCGNDGSGRHLGNLGRIANCGLARRSRYRHTMAAVQNFEIALRLARETIHDINMDRKPNLQTIHELEAVTSPRPTNLSLDVWVCDAIQGALIKKKARARMKL